MNDFNEELMEIKETEAKCIAENKTCANCTKSNKKGKNHFSCFDFTCWRGFIDGNHDGWDGDKK